MQLLSNRLLERFDLVQITPDTILDLACADGYSTLKLEERFKKSKVLGLDVGQSQLKDATSNIGWFKKRRFIQATECALPIAVDTIDCIYSSLLPTWLTDPYRIFSSCKEAIKDNGLILFSTLGPDSLKELKHAWQQVDPEFSHCHRFIDMHDIGDALSRSGFSGIVMESEPLVIEYDTVDEMHCDLKLTGHANLDQNRRKSLLGKNRYAEYMDIMRQSSDKIRCTLEVVYGHAWAGYSKAKIPEHDFRPAEQQIPTIKID